MEFEELMKGKGLYLLALGIIILMFINYYLIFLADTVVTYEAIYNEKGVLEKNMLIPVNISGSILLKTFGKNTYTVMNITSVNGSCIIRAIKSNHTYTLMLEQNNKSVLLRIDQGELFIVKDVKGNMTYTYTIYVENKPYRYLALIAFIISLIGFTISFYILFTLMSNRMFRKRSRKSILSILFLNKFSHVFRPTV